MATTNDAAVSEIAAKNKLVRESAKPNVAKASTDMMGSLTDDFHTANTVARKSALQGTAVANVPAAAPAPAPATKEEKKGGFFSGLGRLFSGKKKPAAATPAAAANPARISGPPTLGKTSTELKAMDDIARKSRQIQKTSNRSAKSTDLMGELTDDFHRMKEDAEPKTKPQGNKEVWD